MICIRSCPQTIGHRTENQKKTSQKNEKKTTNFEHSEDKDVVKKAYLDSKRS